MTKRVIFYDVTRRLLQKRLDMVLAGETPPKTDVRNFWYQCRNTFLRENSKLSKIDSKSTKLYENWSTTIIPVWLVDHAAGPLGIKLRYPPGVVYSKSMGPNEKKDCEWWRIREALNIWAKPSALCVGREKPFLIDTDTREDVTKDRSLILVCEKATVSEELRVRLKEKRYSINIVGMGGCAPAAVIEVVIARAKEMANKKINFYILVLHDYDVKGLEIYFKLKQWGGECVIDVGVNRPFIDYVKAHHDWDMRFVEEKVENSSYNKKLRRWIAQSDNVYSMEDFNYLQGEPFEFINKEGEKEKNRKGEVKLHYNAMRIEIDAIQVEYTIKPFIDFILAKIESACRVWDLRRIGVSDFELEEPDNLFAEAIDEWIVPVREKYEDVYRDLTEPNRRIQAIVKESLDAAGIEKEFKKIQDEHWDLSISDSGINLKAVESLKADIDGVWNREWATIERYTDGLAKVNEQIEYYEGDVRKGEEKLQEQVDVIQGQIHDAHQTEYIESGFAGGLESIDWGEKALDELEVPDENALIDRAIAALQLLREENDI